jgi:RsiW-degrading membrane proteinase PrsW (M82 family)
MHFPFHRSSDLGGMAVLLATGLALCILFFTQYSTDLRAARLLAAGTPWHRIPIYRGLLLFVLLVALPPLLVKVLPFAAALEADRWLMPFSVLIAGLISYTWYRYLTWLDVFEPEKRWSLLLVFGLSCAMMLAVPYLYRAFEAVTGLLLDGTFANDMLYSFAIIGLVEEFTKLVPYLLILLFTRWIDEPYDHLLYISVSALGFAFVENIDYLGASGLYAVGGRALYAAVAHMCFSSMIGYGIARALPKGKGHALLAGVLLYGVAALAHGLYDVWLLAPGRPAFLTTVFFLGTIQLWVIMKNNLVNLSPFAEPHRKLRSTMFRYRIVNAMLGIFMLAYLAVFLMAGPGYAGGLLRTQGLTILVTLLFIALSFGSYHVVPGYVARIRLARNPVRWFIPISRFGSDLSGSRIRIDIPERGWKNLHMPELRRSLPVMGLLERRVVVNGDVDWYLFRPERKLDLGHGFEELFLMKLDADVDTIPSTHYVRMLLYRFDGGPRIVNGEVQGRTVLFGPRFFARLIPAIHGEGQGLSAIGGHGLS